MKHSLLSQHIDFFREHQFISFENLFPEKSLSKVKDYFEELFPIENIKSLSDHGLKEKLFPRIFGAKQILEVLEELTRHKIHCYAGDLLLPSLDLFKTEIPALYTPREKEIYIRDIVSLQDLVCGMLICLKGKNENSLFYPQAVDFVTVVGPKCPLPLSSFQEMKDSVFLLVAYGTHQTRYVEQPLDPNTHRLKKLSYAFGDLIKTPPHPLLSSV